MYYFVVFLNQGMLGSRGGYHKQSWDTRRHPRHLQRLRRRRGQEAFAAGRDRVPAETGFFWLGNYNPPEVDRIWGGNKDYSRVLSKIVAYLLHDGYILTESRN